MQAVNASGETGPWSRESAIDMTGRAMLLAPTNTTGNNTPTIKWTPVADAVRYSLHADNTTSEQQAIIREDQLADASYTPLSPLPAGRYRVWVRAIGADGTSAPWSLPLVFVIE